MAHAACPRRLSPHRRLMRHARMAESRPPRAEKNATGPKSESVFQKPAAEDQPNRWPCIPIERERGKGACWEKHSRVCLNKAGLARSVVSLDGRQRLGFENAAIRSDSDESGSVQLNCAGLIPKKEACPIPCHSNLDGVSLRDRNTRGNRKEFRGSSLKMCWIPLLLRACVGRDPAFGGDQEYLCLAVLAVFGLSRQQRCRNGR